MIHINKLLVVYLVVYLLSTSLGLIIKWVNAGNLRRYRGEIPAPFRGIIDEKELERMDRYTVDKTNLSYVETVISRAIFLFVILSGLLPWLADVLEDVYLIWAGLIFFAVPGLIGAAADLPFEYYHLFRIEDKYGFNTLTRKIWVMDLFKSLLITLFIGVFLLSLLLLMIQYVEGSWWIWAWLIFFGFQILMTIIYPTVIAPIFNKFTPLENRELTERIRRLAEKEGFAIKGIFQMDAGKRSRHSNAYLSGFGKTKRIVLFDTLLGSHDDDEILAVLAHEIGHFKRNHIKKQLVIMGLFSLIFFYLISWMISWAPMYHAFGFSGMPVYVGLFLVAVLWEPLGFFLSPVSMAVSRRFEREADRFAFNVMKSAQPLVKALKKMAKDNLSNLRPHPLYVRFNHSHPPLLERIRALEEMS
ncbi:MAG: M48 family metallopeptidase [Deltaproteobacteria bacterium]|nr:M48 family metallopeptidase [Deltaproteobacteria bacterium]